MLFDIIRDFFVQYVFGGRTSSGDVYTIKIGQAFASAGGNAWQMDLNHLPAYPVTLDNRGYNIDGVMGMADWLSTTATIITLVIILVCIAFFIRWIFKVVSNSILLR